jgi:hypothetical protein
MLCSMTISWHGATTSAHFLAENITDELIRECNEHGFKHMLPELSAFRTKVARKDWLLPEAAEAVPEGSGSVRSASTSSSTSSITRVSAGLT